MADFRRDLPPNCRQPLLSASPQLRLEYPLVSNYKTFTPADKVPPPSLAAEWADNGGSVWDPPSFCAPPTLARSASKGSTADSLAGASGLCAIRRAHVPRFASSPCWERPPSRSRTASEFPALTILLTDILVGFCGIRGTQILRIPLQPLAAMKGHDSQKDRFGQPA